MSTEDVTRGGGRRDKGRNVTGGGREHSRRKRLKNQATKEQDEIGWVTASLL